MKRWIVIASDYIDCPTCDGIYEESARLEFFDSFKSLMLQAVVDMQTVKYGKIYSSRTGKCVGEVSSSGGFHHIQKIHLSVESFHRKEITFNFNNPAKLPIPRV